jgi:hypothetical protein
MVLGQGCASPPGAAIDSGEGTLGDSDETDAELRWSLPTGVPLCGESRWAVRNGHLGDLAPLPGQGAARRFACRHGGRLADIARR